MQFTLPFGDFLEGLLMHKEILNTDKHIRTHFLEYTQGGMSQTVKHTCNHYICEKCCNEKSV